MLYRALPLVLLVGCATAGSEQQEQEGPDAATPAIDAAVVAPDAAGPAGPCMATATTQLLVNPLLDELPAGKGWMQTPIDDLLPIITTDDGLAEESPTLKAWMGGYAQANANDQLYQDVSVPMKTTKLVIKGFYSVATTEPGTAAIKDTATVQLTETTGTMIDAMTNLNNKMPTATWTAINRNVPNAAALSGKTVRLIIKTTNDATAHTNFYFDSFAVTATHCP